MFIKKIYSRSRHLEAFGMYAILPPQAGVNKKISFDKLFLFEA